MKSNSNQLEKARKSYVSYVPLFLALPPAHPPATQIMASNLPLSSTLLMPSITSVSCAAIESALVISTLALASSFLVRSTELTHCDERKTKLLVSLECFWSLPITSFEIFPIPSFLLGFANSNENELTIQLRFSQPENLVSRIVISGPCFVKNTRVEHCKQVKRIIPRGQCETYPIFAFEELNTDTAEGTFAPVDEYFRLHGHCWSVAISRVSLMLVHGDWDAAVAV